MSNSTQTPSSAENEEGRFFPYTPNEIAPIAFIVLFGLLALLHAFQAFKARTIYMIPVIVATVLQSLGYLFRYVVIQDQANGFVYYVISQVFIIVSPAVLAAQIYMVVGRMMSFVGPESTWISHAVITKVFVVLDILTILSQAAGTAFLAGDDENKSVSSLRLGRNILVAGLIVQVVAFVVFMIVTIHFHWKARQIKGSALNVLKTLFLAFYIAGILIVIRSIFRAAEFIEIDVEAEIPEGYLLLNEWPLYALDTVPVFIATIIYNIFHPSKSLPRVKGERMDGTIEPTRKHWWSKLNDTSAPPSEVGLVPIQPQSEYKLNRLA